MSSAERQRRFQARNPGYDRRRKARQRGSADRARVQFAEQWAALTKAAEAAEAAKAAASAQPLALPAPAPVQVMVIPIPTTRLALPAPVEMPMLPDFGGPDHTTVLHAVRTVDSDIKQDPEVSRQITHIEGQLTG